LDGRDDRLGEAWKRGLYFDGRITKPIEYQISFQQAYDRFNLLDAFLHFNYDKRFQYRIGRYKTPYTYEFYKINVWDLFAPERSLFNVNFALNRQLGAAFSGEFFDERMEYAIGAFNGQRNSYQPPILSHAKRVPRQA
jgi:phosphate-selective porin OprO/OprP